MRHPYQEFVNDVAKRSGLERREDVEEAIRSTLAVLAERIRPIDARAVAAQLPPELAGELTSQVRASEDELELTTPLRLLDRICERTGLNERQATIVFRMLAEALDEQARTQLRMHPLGALSLH